MFLSFPPPTKMFQFRGLAQGLLPAGLSHSEISGSILVCKSPELFAAYHVLLRLLKPRHPPYALFRFLCCSRLEIVSFRPLLLPRYLFPILSMNFHWISSGRQLRQASHPLSSQPPGCCVGRSLPFLLPTRNYLQ